MNAVAPLLAELLSIPTADRYPPPTPSPQRRRKQTLEALVAQVTGLSVQQPTLIIFEDVHWIDTTSLELLSLIVDRVHDLRVMVVVTFRPEFTAPWIGQPHVTALSINRLTRNQCRVLVEQLTGENQLPPQVLEHVLAKTDGVPLFVEEMTKTVLESGLTNRRSGQSTPAGRLPPLAIPATLQASLMARLDRLAPVREVAQTGAAIGREFSYELLAAVLRLKGETLHGALEQLVDAGLISRRGLPPDASYSFKHALVQDAAYETLLHSKRQQLHLCIATALEETFPERAEAEPETLAYHYAQAGLADMAIDYWLRAGKIALARSASHEAIAQLSAGLDLLSRLPDSTERRGKELELQIVLGGAQVIAKGQAASATGETFARARQLSDSLGDTAQSFPVLYGQYVHHSSRGQIYLALEITRELLCRAQQLDDSTALIVGHRVVGTALLLLGELPEARTQLERAFSLGTAEPQRFRAHDYIFAPQAITMAYLSMDLLLMGFPEQAESQITAALFEAQRIPHPVTSAVVLGRACLIYGCTYDLAQRTQAAEKLMLLATENQLLNWSGTADIELGWTAVASGQVACGLARMRKGLATIRAVEQGFEVPRYLALLADAHRIAGDGGEALRCLDAALAEANASGERWLAPELHRMKAEILLALSPEDHGTAACCFRKAITLARTQQAKLWELRASTSLCRLLLRDGERIEALSLLAPICGWFTDSKMRDLAAARVLLGELK